MTNHRMLALGVVALTTLGTVAGAQSAQSRIAAVRDGQVRFTFNLRPEVCGSGQNIWRNRGGSSRTTWGNDRRSRDVEYDMDCDSGPGRIVIDKDRGDTRCRPVVPCAEGPWGDAPAPRARHRRQVPDGSPVPRLASH